MSVPRHYNQRPRRKLSPGPHSMQAHHAETATVVEAVVEAEVEVEAVVEAEVVVEAPKWDSSMKKAELLKIAQDLGLKVDDGDTKAAIITALDGTLAGK